MALGGEPLIEEPGFFERNIMPAIRTTSAAISEGPIGIDVTDKAGTVEGAQGLALTQETGMELPDRELFTEEKMTQYAEIMADTEMSPKEKVTALDVLAGGDPDAKDRKASVDDTLKKNKLGKINRKASFPKILTDINKMVESKAGFDIAKSSNPRAAVAFAEGMSGAAETVLGLEADKQKTDYKFDQAMKVAAFKAANTAASSEFAKGKPKYEVAARFVAELIKQGIDADEAYMQGEAMANRLFENQGGGGGGGGGASPVYDANGKEYFEQPDGSFADAEGNKYG
tara:strand:- start:53 stop:910 length:858 start_codon:yes stop_codon:yes gene_type:complete